MAHTRALSTLARSVGHTRWPTRSHPSRRAPPASSQLRISGNNLEEMPALSESHGSLTVFEIHKNRIATVRLSLVSLHLSFLLRTILARRASHLPTFLLRCSQIADTYFASTPALQRLSLWGNMLTALPPSLAACPKLIGLQAHENKLEALPSGAWPLTLETLFLQDNAPLTAIPESLKGCKALKRVNLSNLKLDGTSQGVADALKTQCLDDKDGIFWGTDGMKLAP